MGLFGLVKTDALSTLRQELPFGENLMALKAAIGYPTSIIGIKPNSLPLRIATFGNQ
jgi:hypothetical protein